MQILSTLTLRWLLLGTNLVGLVFVTTLGFGYVFVGVESEVTTAQDPAGFKIKERSGRTTNPEYEAMLKVLRKKPPVVRTTDDKGKSKPVEIPKEIKTPGPLKNYKREHSRRTTDEGSRWKLSNVII